MTGLLKRLGAGGSFLALASCAQLTNYNHTAPISGRYAQATYIDAKQRASYLSPAYDDDTHTMVLKFCAEPSPDALSVIAGSGNAGLSAGDKATLKAAFALAESGGSIGLRTQSIQLMRDSMFRLCEASLSHNTSPQFWSTFKYFQSSMIAILAIEQLTGVAKAPGLQLTSAAAVTPDAQAAATLNDNLTKAKAQLATDQAADTPLKAAKDAAKTDAAKYLNDNNAATEDKLTDDKKAGYAPLKQKVADTQQASDASDAKLKGDDTAVKSYQSALADLAPVLTASGTSATSPATATPEVQQAIANAVQNIVLEQLRTGFFRQTCAVMYDRELAGLPAAAGDAALHRNCDDYAAKTVLMADKNGSQALVQTAANGTTAMTPVVMLAGKLPPAQQANFDRLLGITASPSAALPKHKKK